MHAPVNIPEPVIGASMRHKKVEELLRLKGKIHIDYDWQAEEEKEMQAVEVRQTPE
jgi:CxxC motif-containing protein (DUF1111 family)